VRFETRSEVNAPASVLWQVVADVEHWPEWTPSINEVTWLTGPATAVAAGPVPGAAGPAPVDGQLLRPGGQARIRQPRLPERVWEVTQVEPGLSFTWQAKSSGLTLTGTHEVRPLLGDRAELVLGLELDGPLARPAGFLTRGRIRQNVQQEAEGLKRCAEVAASTPERGL
jgi:polyketide cyclase/dehydrase/lipid transport protein